jgi:glucose/arabinose dehydrogenase
MRIRWAVCLWTVVSGLVACGGKDDPANQPPAPVITQPAEGALFSAGQTLTVAVSATDTEDGALTGASIVWWAELHHDTHTHPFAPQTTGSGGTVVIPNRGETSDNIFYRFHLRATDKAGQSTEVTRDVLPRKARVTLVTVPAGLALTLDGQPVAGGTAFTGVVGMERDLGAADQAFGGRRYRFTSWSDGGAASHTLTTPAADTTLTATFTDIGPVNNTPPTVTLQVPTTAITGVPVNMSAGATDSDGTITRVAFYAGATLLGEDTTSPYSLSWTPTVTGTYVVTARATDDSGATTTSTAVNVTVTAAQADIDPPVVTITAPTAFASGLTGTVAFTATAVDAVGVTSVEFQIDGVPIGSALTGPPYSVNIDSNAHASGQHVLRVRARDVAGNQSAWTTSTISFGGSRTQPAGFTRNTTWVSGLSSATAFAQAPDGRIFISQQGGTLRVVKNGVLQTAPFLTLAVNQNGERGLLGVAFHPSFASNGYVYVYYTTDESTADVTGTHNRISRFTANGDVAAANSELKLVDLPALSTATNHNGGALHFGIDGKLYVAVGDNANSSQAPDLSNPKGKMLRFNDDGTIPTDNPFFGTQTGLARAIWARGLRNPFTFAVRPSDGRIHINDVGEGTWEEINLGVPAANYGWPSSEGQTSTAGISGPLFTYKHSAANPAGSGPGGFFVGFAIAGGAFYPANGPFPAPWKGAYFFADYVNNFVGAIDLANGNAAYAFGNVSGGAVDMLAAADGSLLVLTRSAIVRFSAP